MGWHAINWARVPTLSWWQCGWEMESCQIKPAFYLSEKGKIEYFSKTQILFSIRDVGTWASGGKGTGVIKAQNWVIRKLESSDSCSVSNLLVVLWQMISPLQASFSLYIKWENWILSVPQTFYQIQHLLLYFLPNPIIKLQFKWSSVVVLLWAKRFFLLFLKYWKMLKFLDHFP